MVRLLDACLQVLRHEGMNRMYIDAIKGGDAGFQSIGTQTFSAPLPQSFGQPWIHVDKKKASRNGRHTEKSGRASDTAEVVFLPTNCSRKVHYYNDWLRRAEVRDKSTRFHIMCLSDSDDT